MVLSIPEESHYADISGLTGFKEPQVRQLESLLASHGGRVDIAATVYIVIPIADEGDVDGLR